jgi:hypothetical protein
VSSQSATGFSTGGRLAIAFSSASSRSKRREERPSASSKSAAGRGSGLKPRGSTGSSISPPAVCSTTVSPGSVGSSNDCSTTKGVTAWRQIELVRKRTASNCGGKTSMMLWRICARQHDAGTSPAARMVSIPRP